MTTSVAEFLATRVFYLPSSASFSLFANMTTPATAREFGAWIKDLPALLSESTTLSRPVAGHKRVVSTSSMTLGHPLSSCPPSRRPSSRAGGRTPVIHSRSLSRAPSFGPAFEKTGLGLETVHDFDVSVVEETESDFLKPSHIEVIEEVEVADELDVDPEQSLDPEHELEDGRSRSTKKRGRRGARKSKQFTNGAVDETLEVLASASQTLARQISLASRSSSRPLSSSVSSPVIDISRAASITSSKTPTVLVESHPAATDASASPVSSSTAPAVAKKASKWKLSFGGKGHSSPVDEPAPGTASNVTNLIMGLSAVPAPHSTPLPSASHQIHSPYTRTPLTPQRSPADEAVTWTRGRQPQAFNPNTWSTSSGNGHSQNGVFFERRGPRGASPPSIHSAGPDFTSNSVLSSSANKYNWRSSMSTTSSASTSTSAFTRYSNSSTRSISTMATSVSSGSWRAQTKTSGQSGSNKIYGHNGEQQAIPKNVKSELCMTLACNVYTDSIVTQSCQVYLGNWTSCRVNTIRTQLEISLVNPPSASLVLVSPKIPNLTLSASGPVHLKSSLFINSATPLPPPPISTVSARLAKQAVTVYRRRFRRAKSMRWRRCSPL